MFDSKSPFYVRPSLNTDLFSWGIKFLKNANARHVERSAIPLTELSLLSKSLYQELASQPDFDFGLKEKGILMFYKTDKAPKRKRTWRKKGRELG
jgi:D-amino-acid dehydrogenase